MFQLFEDTTFGQIIRWVSGGKVFAHRDQWDEELRERYVSASQEMQRRDSEELEKGEKGEDYVLIQFLEGDEKVRDDDPWTGHGDEKTYADWV